MRKPIVNLADASVQTQTSGERFEHSIAQLAAAAGAKAIGANVTRVPPGKAAFPLHHHHANEEHFFILSGTGALRWGDEVHDVKQYDYIVNLPGGPERAHQLINTGTEELVYLAISTLRIPEVVGYPDSGKMGVRTATGVDGRVLVPGSAKNTVQYWEGESGERIAAICRRNTTNNS